MSHVGVAACPACGARYGVAAHVLGKQVPCPACGRPFLVQVASPAPLMQTVRQPRAAHPLGLGSDPLEAATAAASAAPLAPAVRPAGWFEGSNVAWLAVGAAVVVGIVVVVLAGVFVIPPLMDTGQRLASESLPIAFDASSPATAGQEGASAVSALGPSLGGRIASALTLSPPDTHLSCVEEMIKLYDESLDVLDGLSIALESGEASPELIKRAYDMAEQLNDLALRWYLLPLPSQEERRELESPLRTFVERRRNDTPGVKRNEPHPLSGPTNRFPMSPTAKNPPLADVFQTALKLYEPGVMLRDSSRAVHGEMQALQKRIEPSQSPIENTYREAISGVRDACRILSRAKTTSDLDRLQPEFDRALARIRAAQRGPFELPADSKIDPFDVLLAYKLRLMHERSMYPRVADAAALRCVAGDLGLKPSAVRPETGDHAAPFQQARDRTSQMAAQIGQALDDLETAGRMALLFPGLAIPRQDVN